MPEIKLDILPVPTFSSLGVNFVKRNIEEYEINSVYITASENRSVVLYTDDDSKPVGEVKVNVADGAQLKLVEVFERKSPYVTKLNALLGESSEFELVQIYIGGSDTVSESVAILNGAKARFTAVIGSALTGEDRLDINLVAEHRGRKSESLIETGSVLNGQSQKTFKGTIDFKNGASGAKGSEHETALLLDSRVRNRTVPVILCEDENVEGNHGATIGRLDEKHVFYLRSRGISEEKIYELMERSMLMQAVSRIDDQTAKSRVFNALGWGDPDE